MINDDPSPTSVVCIFTSNSAGMAMLQSSRKKIQSTFL